MSSNNLKENSIEKRIFHFKGKFMIFVKFRYKILKYLLFFVTLKSLKPYYIIQIDITATSFCIQKYCFLVCFKISTFLKKKNTFCGLMP
jgi:hypothetical protein